MKENNNRSFWQRFAFLYTPFMRINGKGYREICRMLAHDVKKEHQVLEIACGTGQLSLPMAEKAKSWLATDFSPNMLAKAQKRNQPPRPGLSFQMADATKLPYEDEQFDVVVIANALHIMPDPEKALSEIRRVLKKGGHLIAPTFIYRDQAHKTAFSIRLMEKFGFVTFHKWTEAEYVSFVRKHGFPDALFRCISSKPMQECVITAQKEG